MASQVPPDPILTKYQYWNWLNVDEETRRQRALDNTYMMFPTVQNNPTSFSKLFLITDAALTKMANTSYVYSSCMALLSAVNAWLALQNFTTIKTNTINPVGGTLTIGTVLTDTVVLGSNLSTTSLESPFTPLYDNPITTVGSIGYRIDGTLITLTTGSTSAGINNAYVDLSKGNWLLIGQEELVGNPSYYFIAFKSASNEERGRKGSTIQGLTDAKIMCSTFVTVTLTSGTMRWNVNTRAPTGTTLSSATITAYRLS
jgi:hypothetical protein